MFVSDWGLVEIPAFFDLWKNSYIVINNASS